MINSACEQGPTIYAQLVVNAAGKTYLLLDTVNPITPREWGFENSKRPEIGSSEQLAIWLQ